MSAGLQTLRLQRRRHGKPNTSRLRLTSQMDCNGLINPLFVRLYCVLWEFVRRPCCFVLWFGPALENPHQSCTSECEVGVGQHLTGKLLEWHFLLCPLSNGFPFRDRFLVQTEVRMGPFSSTFVAGGFILPDIRTLIHTFGSCVCISFPFWDLCTSFWNFSRCLLQHGNHFKQKFLEMIACQCYFSHQVKWPLKVLKIYI